MNYDVFISHATEDKIDVVEPLVRLLVKHNAKVWVDNSTLNSMENLTTLSPGDSLMRRIEHGLAKSRYAVVILSPNYFKKEWTLKELNALVARENGKTKVIIPVLHNLTSEELKEHSLILADKLAVSTTQGIDIVAREILNVIQAELLQSAKRTVIGISGASCSGKSWFAQKIKEARPNSVTLFDLDSYYRDITYVNGLYCRHDNPKAINFEQALRDLTLLLNGHSITIPVYDYDSHKKISERICTPAPTIIIEGLFVFSNQSFLNEMDLKIWIEARDDIRYDRRIDRDTTKRGRSIEEVRSRYRSDVTPGYQRYIEPCREFADMVYLNSTDRDVKPSLIHMILSHGDINSLF